MTNYSYIPKTFRILPEYYSVIVNNDKTVGGANLVFGAGEVYILNVEIGERNKRYGTLFVLSLFKTVNTIYGCATPSSKGFWIKMGAKFKSEFEFTITEV